MKSETQVIHYPRLDTVIMIETAIKNAGEFPSKRQLWLSLPKQVMYQTFVLVLGYLEESGKIMYTKENKIFWVHNPELERKILAEGVRIR